MLKLNAGFNSVYSRLPSPIQDLSASAYALWSKRVKYGGVFREWRDFLEESQWWTAEQVRAYQVGQVRDFIQWIEQESPFYREQIRKGAIRSDLSDPFELIGQFPVIDRAVVKANYNGIKTRVATDQKLTLSTSGTTGASLHVPMTRETFQREYAFRWQYYAMGGAQRGDRFAFFQGHMVVPVGRTSPPFHVRNYAENSLLFSLYHMNETSLRHYVEVWNSFAPDFTYGYPSGIWVFASFAKKHGLHLAPPKAVFTASEMLHDFQRQLFEEVFQAPVFQWYGQVETTANLHECPEHRLHVKEEYGLLEILARDGQPARPGESGQAVATGWGNRAFPLVRYQTGDNMVLSAEERCPCGRAGRIIERIAGRDDDFIVTPEGRYVGRLDFVFKAVDTVRESQIVQEDLKTIFVKVVPLEGFSDKDRATIVSKLQERIGCSMEIRVIIVSDIPRGGSGKFRYVISKVSGSLISATQPA